MIKERDFKGVWIDKSIWLSKELSLQEKVFLVEIDSLDRDDKGCFAGNGYFAEFFGLSEDRCSTIISSLKKKLFITVEVDKSSGKSKRKIHTIMLNTTRPKSRVDVGGNAEWPLGGKAAPNNTYINNTNNKITASAELNEGAKQVFDLFKDINPSYETLFKRKHEWSAARTLYEKYGIPYLEKIAKLVRAGNKMPYAPVIVSPAELESKMAKLESFWEQKKAKGEKNKIAIAI